MRPVIIIIPARYASSRYPGKPLVEIKGASGVQSTLIERSWRAAKAVTKATHVVVATDDERIANKAQSFGADVVMTSQECRNGTERCAEVAALPAYATLNSAVFVNLQGDAPLTPVDIVEQLIAHMLTAHAPQVATPALRCSDAVYQHLVEDQRHGRVGGTTMVFNARHKALYFSKRVIPHLPPPTQPPYPVHLHMGLYAYSAAALAAYRAAPPSSLELLEGLEQLRFLDIGTEIDCVECPAPRIDPIELNNPQDLPLIEALLARHNIV